MFYFHPLVQEVIQKELKRIMGKENKEDAIQEAYVAISDEQPMTVEDACGCASRAIYRFRNKARRISKHEQRDDDSWTGNPSRYLDRYLEGANTDTDGHTQKWWDTMASKTPVFNKQDRDEIKRVLAYGS